MYENLGNRLFASLKEAYCMPLTFFVGFVIKSAEHDIFVNVFHG